MNACILVCLHTNFKIFCQEKNSGVMSEVELDSAQRCPQGHDLPWVAVTIAALPQDMNMLESIVLPVSMPFLGRG